LPECERVPFLGHPTWPAIGIGKISVVGEAVEKIKDVILRLWEHGLYFFWTVAFVGAATFIVFFAAYLFQLGNGPDLFKAHGWLPLTVTIGTAFPIMPQAFSRTCCDLIVDRPIGKTGNTITATVAVCDERGRRRKVKFDNLRSIIQGTV
jgi:hypothetical protein